MDDKVLFTAALGLSAPWRVGAVRFDAAAKRLDLEIVSDAPRGATFPCPGCARLVPAHDRVGKEWRHLDFFQHEARLSAKVPRTKCPDCGLRHLDVPWSRPTSGFTLMFEALVMTMARAMPISSVAALLGEHDTLVWRIVHHYVSDASARADFSGVASVAFDETQMGKGQDYVTVFADAAERKVLAVFKGHDAAVVGSFAETLSKKGGDPLRVLEASVDLSQAFTSGISSHLPNATPTYDRFHVMKLAGGAVDQVRRQESREHPELKGTRYSWLKNEENLTDTQAAALLALKDQPLLTSAAWTLRLGLQEVYAGDDRKDGEARLDAWLAKAEASGLAPMRKLAATIAGHREGILRWFDSGLTNGFMEGLNSVIQMAKARARGYRSLRNFEAVIMLMFGKLDLAVST